MTRKYEIIIMENMVNVQEWNSTNGRDYYYTGNGRFCGSVEEAEAWIAEQERR